MYEAVIVGAGPAGTGSLVWAARNGYLAQWLDAGLLLVDRRQSRTGTVGRYALNADSLGTSFLECLNGPCCETPIRELRADPVSQALEAWRHAYPPLPLVGRFLERLCAALEREFARHPASRMLAGTQALSLQLNADGSITVHLAGPLGERHAARASSAVLALGGCQNTRWDAIEIAPGIRLSRWANKLMTSESLLTRGGSALARHRLPVERQARVAVLGGSHSAFSAAWVLIHHVPGVRFGAAGVRILYRTEPRVFYPTAHDAEADGYGFSPRDVCAQTGRINRLGGLRGDGRELWRRMTRRPGAIPEDRVLARPIGGLPSHDLARILDAADLIVPAFGYRPVRLPVFDTHGRRIPLAATGPAVGPDARVLTASGDALPNVFGVGLGSGFLPWGEMSGEPSFQGQQNSLWLYQNGLGALIHAGVRDCAARRTGAGSIPRAAFAFAQGETR